MPSEEPLKESQKREYGFAALNVKKDEGLFKGVGEKTNTWMSHGDSIEKLPGVLSQRLPLKIQKWLQRSITKKIFTASSSTPKFIIPPGAKQCFATFFSMCAGANEHGP